MSSKLVGVRNCWGNRDQLRPSAVCHSQLNKIGYVCVFVGLDKYRTNEDLFNCVENVLEIFCFDRTLYGKSKDKKWWMELKRNRIRDVQAEAGVR